MYDVDFVQDPSIVIFVGSDYLIDLAGDSIKENYGLSIKGKVATKVEESVGLKVREGDFTKKGLEILGEVFKDSTRYEVGIQLQGLESMAEEVIKKDTGVDVKDRVHVRVDYFINTVGISLDKEKFTEDEVEQLGDYSLEDKDKNIRLVIERYYSKLGGEDKNIKTYSENLGEEPDDLCVITINTN